MGNIKVHIIFKFRNEPWGGCNQFLSALRDELKRIDSWVESPHLADVILFDSFNNVNEVIRWKQLLPRIPFIQRIDGPISGYRGKDKHLDRLVHALSYWIADGVVFQSNFSREENLALGMPIERFSCVITNASNPIFRGAQKRERADRIRIISVSWSKHWNKGFDVLLFLDRKLDFSRFSLTFIGNSPVKFKNISKLAPQLPIAVSEQLSYHDIFLAPSRNDPCSNALVEALSMGLPAVARQSGGHPELVGMGGILFDDTSDVIRCIEKISCDLDFFQKKIVVPTISEIANQYLSFFSEVLAGGAPFQRLTIHGLFVLRIHLAIRKIFLWLNGLARMCRVAF